MLVKWRPLPGKSRLDYSLPKGTKTLPKAGRPIARIIKEHRSSGDDGTQQRRHKSFCAATAIPGFGSTPRTNKIDRLSDRRVGDCCPCAGEAPSHFEADLGESWGPR
jgi:hypothetical protein